MKSSLSSCSGTRGEAAEMERAMDFSSGHRGDAAAIERAMGSCSGHGGEAADYAAATGAAAVQDSEYRPATGAGAAVGAAAIPAASPPGPGRTVTMFLAIWLSASQAFAFLDSLADTARDAAKAAAYTSAVGDLASDLKASEANARAAADLASRTKTAGDAKWTTQHLASSLSYTNRFIQRARRMFVSMGLAGTDVATALNTAETNGALNEVIKNQQADLLLKEEERVSRKEERESWREFIQRERNERRALR